MTRKSPSSIEAALEVLLEEIEAEIDSVNQIGATAFESRQYDRVREALQRTDQVVAFRDKTELLRREWATIAGQNHGDEDLLDQDSPSRELGRLARGLRTPEKSYYLPILQALNFLGGSGPTGKVLDRVLEIMRDELREVDFEPLNANPDMPRWRNAAQWARNSMVSDGLVKNDSPHGVWAISEEGKRVLSELETPVANEIDTVEEDGDLIERVLRRLGRLEGADVLGPHKFRAYSLRNGAGEEKLAVVRQASHQQDAGCYWTAIRAKALDRMRHQKVSHLVIVLKSKGFACVPMSIVEEYLPNANKTRDKHTSEVVTYQIYISDSGPPELFHRNNAGQGLRYSIAQYYEELGSD